MNMDEKKISSTLIHSNPFWDYFVDKFKIKTGETKEYYHIKMTHSVMVIPCLLEDRFIMLKQMRLPTNIISLEFPGGGIQKDETEINAAKRELKEETGYGCKTISKLGLLHPCNGLTNEVCSVFLAEDLIVGKAQPDVTEELEIINLSRNEVIQAFNTKEPIDSVTFSAWSLYNMKNKKVP